jgi:hypothetical protein
VCPLCITTAVMSAAGATSGAGVIAVAARKWRTLQRWYRQLLARTNPEACAGGGAGGR